MSTATLAPRSALDEIEYWDDEDCDLGADSGPLVDRMSGAYDQARSDAAVAFALLADDLESVMLVTGSTRRLTQHPAYTEILALGDEAIPLLLERLAYPGARPLWLRLLGALTAFQPGAGKNTVSEATIAWIKWGKRRGFIGAV